MRVNILITRDSHKIFYLITQLLYTFINNNLLEKILKHQLHICNEEEHK